ncbi:unnamed protein product [Thelazia callipaeda]|uniref:SWIB domain-containing protein n=1 Tax=Thelazia callipaeda TaxID=103827 RepID=A0A0N5D4L5_THECL|nr:unnamed protein product [Thelazia callipaeda]
MDVLKGSSILPVEVHLIRDEIARQIQQFGMDKLTSRIIRENLKHTFGSDFSAHKAAIDEITMDVIKRNNDEKVKRKANSSSKSCNSDSESEDGIVFTDPTPKKKIKEARKRKDSESDAQLLEVGQKRRRAAVAAKQCTRKKSKGSGEGKSKSGRRKGPYNVYCALTDDLAAVCGKQYMRRCDVIKAMWAYFRSNNLLDPKDKRYVLPNEPLMKIFKRRFLAFGLMKDLASHIIEPKFLDQEQRAALEKFEAEEEARLEAESESSNTNDNEQQKQKCVSAKDIATEEKDDEDSEV